MAYEHRKKPEITLTDEQKELICHLFATLPPEELNLKNITQKAFNNTKLNGQTQEGRVVKGFMGSSGFEFKTRTTPVPKGAAPLTDDQKKQIDANIGGLVRGDIGIVELARLIWKNEGLSNLHQETRTVQSYYNDKLEMMDAKDFDGIAVPKIRGDDIATDDYRAPKRNCEVIAKVNKYLGLSLKESELKQSEVKKIESLKRHLSVYRFIYQMNQYGKNSQRDLFEDSIVRSLYNEIDVSAEDLDQYITLGSEIVISYDIQAHLKILKTAQEAQRDESDGKKIHLGLNDAINKANTEYNQCITRQKGLYSQLTTKRASKIEKQNKEFTSILPFSVAWKQEDFRHRYAHLGELKKKMLKEEIKRIGDMDEMKAMVRGMTIEEILGESDA
jgi:hypothetical protein